jgi:hypothetical protein
MRALVGPPDDRRARPPGVLVLLALLGASGCQPSPTGISVDVDMTGGFKDSVKTLQLTFKIDRGFRDTGPTTMNQVSITYSAAGDLVMTFSAATRPFTDYLAFRVETGNQTERTVAVDALGFDGGGQKIASAHASGARLPANGEARVSLKLVTDVDGTNIGNTTLDLATATLDRKLTGPGRPADLATVAVCDFEGTRTGDLVIGVPDADQSSAIMGTGAVYIIPHASGDLDLGTAGASAEFHFFGVNGGDRLGASISCFDYDGDGADDLVVGAPGATGAPLQDHAGRVYILQGRSMVRNRSVDLRNHEAEIEYFGGTAGAALGTQVLGVKLQGGGGELLVSAPGEGTGGVVHLMTIGGGRFPTPPATATLLFGTLGHPTFSGIRPAAMVVGDLDGDGAVAGGSEVILGDPSFNLTTGGTMTGVGAVYVYRNVDPRQGTAYTLADGGATGWARRMLGATQNLLLGLSLLAVNVSGKGADLIIASPGRDSARGAVEMYEHDREFFSVQQLPTWTLQGASMGERFGTTLAVGPARLPAGDAPLQVGAPEASSGARGSAGAVYTFARSASGSSAAPPEVRPRLIGAAAKDRLGAAIAAGPIGGADTISDLVMLAPGLSNATTPGVAYVRLAKTAP